MSRSAAVPELWTLIAILSMEPLLDKLARQKPVRMVFKAICICDKQSDRLMATRRVRRFAVSTICALFAPFAVYMSMLLFTDWDIPSFYLNACFVVLLVIEWPLVLFSYLFLPSGPPIIVFVFLYLISGLFWASVVDLFFFWRKKYVV